MNELLPYEEQLAGRLADVPLPGEDKGWDAMRKMLEEDDDNGIVAPVNKGCRTLGASLLLIALLAGIIFIAYKTTTNKTNVPGNSAALKDSSLASTTSVQKSSPAGAGVDSLALPVNISKAKSSDTNTVKQKSTDRSIQKTASAGIQNGDSKIAVKQAINYRLSKSAVAGNSNAQTNKSAFNSITPGKEVTTPADNKPAESGGRKKEQPVSGKDSTNTAIIPPANLQTGTLTSNKIDTATTVSKSDTANKKSLAGNAKPRPGASDNKSPKDNKVWFGAGLALQQLVPVDGQKAVPYNASGRKGSLGDYIPSAYFRVYQNKKFLQVEFKYGAPQYTKDIAYEQKVTSHDSGSDVTVSNINHVKKTYYHQLPVSIHYDVLPNLSVGAGFVWNKFQSAVVQQVTQTLVTQGPGGPPNPDSTTLVPGKILQLKGDSATQFSKSYFQFMFEAQYTWKRFSLGARYAFGLQPYLTFTSPTTGQTQKERNASLNIFLRYELWRSKKK